MVILCSNRVSDELIWIHALPSYLLTPLCKLLIDIGHQQVKELTCHGRVQGTGKFHFYLIVNDAPITGRFRIYADDPLWTQWVEYARTVTDGGNFPEQAFLLFIAIKVHRQFRVDECYFWSVVECHSVETDSSWGGESSFYYVAGVVALIFVLGGGICMTGWHVWDEKRVGINVLDHTEKEMWVER